MSIKLNSSGGGSVTLQEPNTASTRTLTFPDLNGTVGVAGPAFSAIQTADQSVTSGTYAKVTLGNELFDTDNCFANSRFTPTVAGYYQVNGIIRGSANAGTLSQAIAAIYKNGTIFEVNSTLPSAGMTTLYANITDIIYLNGTTDYVELYGLLSGTSPLFDYNSDANCCRFSASLVRAA